MYNPNPYMPIGMGQSPFTAPVGAAFPTRQEVVKVNGENGAKAFSLGANSSAILLDESGTMVWLVVTDGAGYKTVTPYDIQPHQIPNAPDYSSLEERIRRIEERLNDTRYIETTPSRTVVIAEDNAEYDKNNGESHSNATKSRQSKS